jgi:uncharacterized membrane protein
MTKFPGWWTSTPQTRRRDRLFLASAVVSVCAFVALLLTRNAFVWAAALTYLVVSTIYVQMSSPWVRSRLRARRRR